MSISPSTDTQCCICQEMAISPRSPARTRSERRQDRFANPRSSFLCAGRHAEAADSVSRSIDGLRRRAMPNVSTELARFGRRANSRSSKNSAILDASANSSSSRACHTPLIHSETSIRPASRLTSSGHAMPSVLPEARLASLRRFSARTPSSAGSWVAAKAASSCLISAFSFSRVLHPRRGAGRIEAWT